LLVPYVMINTVYKVSCSGSHLDVAVDDAALVEVGDGADDAVHEVGGAPLRLFFLCLSSSTTSKCIYTRMSYFKVITLPSHVFILK
jgi:hypothetical protein